MNEDASTYELPEYIHSRLMPQILIDFPDKDEERAILSAQVEGIDQQVLEYVLGFLRAAHLADLRYSVRDGLNIARYAMKRLHRKEAGDAAEAVDTALRLALGPEAGPFLIGS
jgi:MoxR-like ATPase